MSYATALRCRKCGREYPLEPLNLCDFCFSPLEVSYDHKSVAGLRKLVTSGIIQRNELTVAFITGAGPKTQEVIAERVHPFVIQPTLESFEEVFGK